MVTRPVRVPAALGTFAGLAIVLAAALLATPAGAVQSRHIPRVHPAARLDDLAHEAIIGVLDGRGVSSLPDQDPTTNPHSLEADLSPKRADLKLRGIDLDVISVQNFTGLAGRLLVGDRIYASLQDLQDVHAQGGTVVSEGIDHTSLAGASPIRQWTDTCGVQPTFYGTHGINIQAMHAYTGGRLRPTVQRDFVSRCFAWGRSYGSEPNTPSTLTTYPYIMRVRSLNGGCPTPDRTCQGTTTPYKYLPREELLAWLTPATGQIKVLQPYDGIKGVHLSGQFSWDCTPGARHWSSFTEGYCWDDMLWALDHLPRRVEVTSLTRLAAALGRAPDQLPGAPAPRP